MDKANYVHRRKKRYMAQLLDNFEQYVEPHLPPDVADRFKGKIRKKMHALALDSVEIINLKPGEELNGYAVELRDRLHGDSRPTQQRSSA